MIPGIQATRKQDRGNWIDSETGLNTLDTQLDNAKNKVMPDTDT